MGQIFFRAFAQQRAQVDAIFFSGDGRTYILNDGSIIKKPLSVSGGSVGLFDGNRIGRAQNLEKLATAQRALSGDPAAGISARRIQRVSAPRAAEAQEILEELSPERLALTREGFLRVDSLLHRFFLPQHRGIRYT